MAMSVVEEKEIEDTQVHIRGSVHNLGETAPRGFLQVATVRHAARRCPTNESGRRELAEWLAVAGQPADGPRDRQPRLALAVRRRAWSAPTTTSAPPARRRRTRSCSTTWRSRFVEDGWSMKKLVRAIVLSPDVSAVVGRRRRRRRPPTRRTGCSARANRRRLEAECIRDTMLAVSGQLDRDHGRADVPGRAWRRTTATSTPTRRRSVYRRCSATRCRSCSRCSTSPTRAWSTGRRNVSTVAPQALFLLNHPFVVGAGPARGRAAAGGAGAGRRGAGSTRAYRLTLGRAPTAGERRAGAAVPRATGRRRRRRRGRRCSRRCSRRPISGT